MNARSARPPLIVVLVWMLVVGASATARTEVAFDDVPPCHWAAEAVADLAHLGIFVGFPPDPEYAAVNALRQVFEGLRCADPAWSLRFLSGAPARFGLLAQVTTVQGFELATTTVTRADPDLVVAFALTVVLELDGARSIVQRSGSVVVSRGPDGWRVPYQELAALELPIFP